MALSRVRNGRVNRSRYSRWRPLLGAGFRTGLRLMRNRMMSNTRTTRNSNTSDNPLTEQRDWKVDYRKRRMTRRRRRVFKRKRRFRRSVEWANLKNTQVPKRIVRESKFVRSADTDQSGFCSALMHTVDGEFNPLNPDANGNPQADWREFFIEGGTVYKDAWDHAADPVTGVANPAYPSVGLRYRGILSMGCTMEVIVRNSSNQQVTVNAYYVRCRRNVPGSYRTLEKLYDEGFRRSGRVSEDPLTGSNPWDAQIESTDIAATPFQNSLFCRHYTVLRRTKYELSPGHYFTVLTKDKKIRKMYMTNAITQHSLKGWTEGWLFDFQGVILNEMTLLNPPVDISVQILRRYSLSFLPLKLQQTSYDIPDS